jgi:hypothetical protein
MQTGVVESEKVEDFPFMGVYLRQNIAKIKACAKGAVCLIVLFPYPL